MDNKNIVGYTLSISDNDTYMFPEDMAVGIQKNALRRVADYRNGLISQTIQISKSDLDKNKCPLCGYRLDFQPHNKKYKGPKKSKDIGSTYDGQTIVSVKVKEFFEAKEIEGLIFRDFIEAPSYFQLIVKKEINFDFKRRGTRFENQCPVCQNYESVVGANPAYLLILNSLPTGVYRSNLNFASGNEKSPILIISKDLKMEMEKNSFKDLSFGPAYGTASGT